MVAYIDVARPIYAMDKNGPNTSAFTHGTPSDRAASSCMDLEKMTKNSGSDENLSDCAV